MFRKTIKGSRTYILILFDCTVDNLMGVTDELNTPLGTTPFPMYLRET